MKRPLHLTHYRQPVSHLVMVFYSINSVSGCIRLLQMYANKAMEADVLEEDNDLIFAARPNLITREEFIRNHPEFRSADVDID